MALDMGTPLLFILVGEILHQLLEKAIRKNIFEGVRYNSHKNVIIHLQFADDTILFIKNDLHPVTGIKRVLQCFELLSGLKINFFKSFLFGFRCDPKDINFWASKLRCKVGALPINYLEMQMGINPKSKLFWQPIVLRTREKLAMWKSKYLNQAGVFTEILIRQSPKLLVWDVQNANSNTERAGQDQSKVFLG